MMTHPEMHRLAALLDGALGDGEREHVRAHLLTCPRCAARLRRLQADAERIVSSTASERAPDVRALVLAR
ncbi:MAG TPA: anti-sigma factor, partial [Roseiflexaceae bacterium]|nr:anti-sigma factor [Roseiflexaceae bacterium]